MIKKSNRNLALIISIALVFTSFISFGAATHVYGAAKNKGGVENIRDTAPAKPTWSAEPAIPGDQSVTLSWDPNMETDLYGYQLEYKNDNGKNWMRVTDITSTTYYVEGLTNGIAYQFRIRAVDQAGNLSKYSNIITSTPYVAEETVIDTTPPVITLYGEEVLNLIVGEPFTEPGFLATDDIDGDITARVAVNGNVDTNTAGTYVIGYNVSDAAGNAAMEKTRTVTVAEGTNIDTTPPSVITLSNGGMEYCLEYGVSVDLVFSEELNDASKLAVERELFYVNSYGVDTGACNHTLQFEWISPTILRVTRDAGLTGDDLVSPGIFIRNAVVNVTDLAGNTSEVTLVISDPAPAIKKLWIYVNGSTTGIASTHDIYQIGITQGSVITKIMIEMTEPVIIDGAPVLTFNINDIDHEFGKITLPWPTNPVKLRVYPGSGAPIEGISGIWILNFPEGSTTDLGPFSQTNRLTTYYLIAE